jgi:hypothetical protein
MDTRKSTYRDAGIDDPLAWDLDFVKQTYLDYGGDSLSETLEDVPDDLAEQILGVFRDLSTKSEVTIYRVVEADSAESVRTDDMGESWSFERDAAIEFGEENVPGPRWIITGKTKPDNIDWDHALCNYMEFGIAGRELELPVIDDSDKAISVISIEPAN